MAGYTDKPMGERPYCPECNEHRWAWDGRCISPQCYPMSSRPLTVKKKHAKVPPKQAPTKENDKWYRESMQ